MNTPAQTSTAARLFGSLLLLIGLLATPLAQAGGPEGYAVNAAGEIVYNDFGECVHTSSWKESMAIMQCEPKLAAANQPQPEPEPETEMAAMEPEPEPERVVRRISLSSDTNFAFDSAKLSAEGKRRLDRIARQARTSQDPSLRIVGYTDRIGPETYNMKLSQQRAAAVKEYLEAQGVSTEIMQVDARGEADPIKRCEGMRGQALIDCLAPNRRTDIEFSAFEVVEP